MRIAITESVIAEHRRVGSSTRDLWDATVRGLVLRVRPTGRATWFVRMTAADGRRTSIKLGEHGAMKPAEARKLALVQPGADQQGRAPVAERRAAAAPTQAGLLMRRSPSR